MKMQHNTQHTNYIYRCQNKKSQNTIYISRLEVITYAYNDTVASTVSQLIKKFPSSPFY